jgi:hypothetical protein
MTRAILWTAGIAFALELAFIAVLGYAAGLRVMMIAVAIGFIGRVLARLVAGPPAGERRS